ncbi:MAG: hypothetical protein WCL44_05565 [bacterium]
MSDGGGYVDAVVRAPRLQRGIRHAAVRASNQSGKKLLGCQVVGWEKTNDHGKSYSVLVAAIVHRKADESVNENGDESQVRNGPDGGVRKHSRRVRQGQCQGRHHDARPGRLDSHRTTSASHLTVSAWTSS